MLTDHGVKFTVREVRQTEVDILTQIHEKCFPRYWNRAAFTDFFAIENTFAQLVEKENIPIAMMVYRATFEQADIITLAVIPSYRQSGIAKILVDKMLDKCKDLGVKKIFLEVEVGNEPAIKLYENFDFKHINRRKLYYQQLDGSLTDALVMSKKLG